MNRVSSPAQELLQQYINGYNARNMQAVLDLLKDDFIGWGTSKDEYWVGKAAMEKQLNRDWSQAEFGEINLDFFIPSSTSNWAAAECSVRLIIDGQEMRIGHLRGSIFVEDGKIAYLHSSFPDPTAPEGSSFPTLSQACPE